MLEIQQTGLDMPNLGTLGTSLADPGSVSGNVPMGPPPPADQLQRSDKAAFLGEFNKLSATEKQEVTDFLDQYAAAHKNGENTSELDSNIPQFLQKMLQADIGGGEEMPIYSSSINAQYQHQQQMSAAGGQKGGQGVSAAQMVQGTLTEIDSAEAGMVDASVEAANNAPSELQQLADDSGKELSSLLKQYLDAGMSEEVAYEMVKNDLRQSSTEPKDDTKNADQKTTRTKKESHE